ncbi:integral membrane efflux protein [Streptomyces davaonensis JCM 4913]|uniref:Integral membrane efflux protein n=1 Tax=Streptomyces davaonensis (strain DSM 101723 / JCM 4913 / KCC S-0913 / 768) TaxID=1214101 RepID=K4QZK1_STRDJ|nr:DHA2 family efflux MFS transporter permease subunit [Streptomyces davaonensis]CCK26513.1 integral membrane efflux protein [Streptomyces davaonensis JCM 4913]
MTEDSLAERYPHRWWALGVLSLSLLIIGLDTTILNIALSTLATDLDADNRDLQWITDSYILVFAGLLLPAGAFGDRFGRKRVLIAGLVVFGVASVWCAWAPSADSLILARALMGLGAAVVTPLSLSLVPVMFTEQERSRAIAVWSVGMMLGLPLGPLVGGWLLEHYWWGSVFLINVPFIAVALLAGGALVPETRDPAKPRVDYAGALLITVGLAALVFGIIEGPNEGWSDPLIIGTLLGGAGLVVAFVLWERRAAQPLIDLSLFGNRRFTGATAVATAVSFTMFGVLFIVPQYLQVVLDNGTFGTGLRLLPLIVAFMLSAGVGDAMAKRLGPRATIAAGSVLLAGGLVYGAWSATTEGYGPIATAMTVMGLGLGLSLPTAMDVIVGELPENRTGTGVALTMAVRQVAAALGVALLGSLIASVYDDRVSSVADELGGEAGRIATDSVAGAAAVAARLDPSTGERLREAAFDGFTDALAVSFWVCAATALAGALAAAALLGRPRRRSPDRSRTTATL